MNIRGFSLVPIKALLTTGQLISVSARQLRLSTLTV